MKNRPPQTSPEAWEKHWKGAGYTLEPLAKTLLEIARDVEKVAATDFDCPNHYAKLAYNAGQKAMLDKMLALFPESVDKTLK